nr:alpha/beta hydrolase [uncultured bacterium]
MGRGCGLPTKRIHIHRWRSAPAQHSRGATGSRDDLNNMRPRAYPFNSDKDTERLSFG